MLWQIFLFPFSISVSVCVTLVHFNRVALLHVYARYTCVYCTNAHFVLNLPFKYFLVVVVVVAAATFFFFLHQNSYVTSNDAGQCCVYMPISSNSKLYALSQHIVVHSHFTQSTEQESNRRDGALFCLAISLSHIVLFSLRQGLFRHLFKLILEYETNA